MDSGAHFHCCDFQVHTPRDRNWAGDRPASDADRKAYATEFVQACKDKGLDAVAITDHHDVAFFRYIKEAAGDDLVVFPGMELTLGVPCQALLILDADFPLSFLTQIPRILGVNTAPDEDAVHAETQPLASTLEITAVIDLLERQDFLNGRYILIPNVTENGHKSLLRSGFREHYTRMPCIAGYVDGRVPARSATGWWGITDGEDRNYGKKRLGVYQTSDARHRDFRSLGSASTWVKWAEPTAEALRQACLARETRLSLEPPALPAIQIRRLQVSNSQFLGPVELELNPQCNCLIGGRGTGKSTVLEYLRWALCDQPPEASDEDSVPGIDSRRAELIANTLNPYGSVVTIEFELNGVLHTVRRKSSPAHLQLKIGSEDFRDCSEHEVRDLLPIQAYSQKQLSSVGIRTDELLRLLRAPIKSDLADLDRRAGEVLARLRSTAELRHSKRQAHRDLQREETEQRSVTSQLKKLREGMKGVTEDDQRTLEAHPGVESEGGYVRTINDRVRRLKEAVQNLRTELERLATPLVREDMQSTPNAEHVQQIADAYRQLYEGVAGQVRALEESVITGEHVRALDGHLQRWRALAEQHGTEYEQAKVRASSQQSVLKAISELEGRRNRLTESVSTRQAAIERMGNPDGDYQRLLDTWMTVAGERASLLANQCERLTQLSQNRIRARLLAAQDTQELQRRLQGLTTGTRIRTTKLEALCAHVAAAEEPLREWSNVAEELGSLVGLADDELAETDLPDTPILNRTGFTAGELERVARRISVQEWMNVALVPLGDEPRFEYRQTPTDFIAFANASAGQQATALLHVLLNQPGPPLIIDQPEEDLDNEVVLDVVEAIWGAKTHRQLIMSSHNANVVVNGDADLVIVCGYRTAGDHSGGRIADAGAIDVRRIRDHITKIMEGGERAFRLRKEKYGF